MEQVASRRHFGQPEAAPHFPQQFMAHTSSSSNNNTTHQTISGDHNRRSAYRTKVCRYYQAGYCRDGTACPFKHSASDDANAYGEEIKRKNSSSDASKSSRIPPHNRERPSITIPSTSYPIHPAYVYPSGWVHQVGSTPSESPASERINFRHAGVALASSKSPLGTGPDVHSPVRLSPIEHFNYLSDDLMTPLEDLRLSEPFIRRPSHPYMAAASPSAFYLPVMSPATGYGVIPTPYADRFGIPSAKPSGRSHRSHSESKKITTAYKTKLCKFWSQDGSCPNGPKCTFIHDEPMPTSQSSDGDSTEVGSPSSVLSSQLPHDLPTKPLSTIEEKKKQGFYPISWRVIGGGVMMSGRREVCRFHLAGQCDQGDECAYLHDVDSDDSVSQPSESDWHEDQDDVVLSRSPPSLHGPGSSKSRIEGKVKPQRPMSIAVPPATNFFPASEPHNSALPTAVPLDVQNAKESASSKAHRRTRSMTIPPTPGSPRLDAINLFSAESPGNL